MYKFRLLIRLNREMSGYFNWGFSARKSGYWVDWTERCQATSSECQPAWKTGCWVTYRDCNMTGKGRLKLPANNSYRTELYTQSCYIMYDHSAHALGTPHAEYIVHVKYCKHAQIQYSTFMFTHIISSTSAISLRLAPLMICSNVWAIPTYRVLQTLWLHYAYIQCFPQYTWNRVGPPACL